MSYDYIIKLCKWSFLIEGSPDHWWVTTLERNWYLQLLIEGSPDHWWVTTSYPQLISPRISIEGSPDHWWVTTITYSLNDLWTRLKGHQIIGELRPSTIASFVMPKDWRVTRSLVSYDLFKRRSTAETWLKGHQIIGELRLMAKSTQTTATDWRVTRSLVSYDFSK